MSGAATCTRTCWSSYSLSLYSSALALAQPSPRLFVFPTADV